MIKKTIEFMNYDGELIKEDYYFHLTKVDVIKMAAKVGMDLVEYLEQMVDRKDAMEIIEFLETIILLSVGKRHATSGSFYRNKALTEEFEYSNAYAELFEELMTAPDAAHTFMSSLVTQPAKSVIVDKKVESANQLDMHKIDENEEREALLARLRELH